MKRLEQTILIVTFWCFCWLAMQAVHELGHVMAALITGATITKVALHPFIISRTDLGHNPHPGMVVWAGPLVGCLLPALAYYAAKYLRSPGLYLYRFFAGFCLISNGAYIGFASAEGGADSAIMIMHGAPRWLLIIFGLTAIAYGLSLWHRQGPHFGLGEAKGKVDRKAVIVSAILFLAIFVIELIVNSK